VFFDFTFFRSTHAGSPSFYPPTTPLDQKDAIPTATIAFLLDYFFWKAQAEDEMQNARSRRAASKERDVVDVRATRVDD
jgi:hypothetical protein